MASSQIPASDPVRVAPDTWLIANLAAAGPGQYLPVNSLLIRGSEPIIVDTGAPVHRRGQRGRADKYPSVSRPRYTMYGG